MVFGFPSITPCKIPLDAILKYWPQWDGIPEIQMQAVLDWSVSENCYFFSFKFAKNCLLSHWIRLPNGGFVLNLDHFDWLVNAMFRFLSRKFDFFLIASTASSCSVAKVLWVQIRLSFSSGLFLSSGVGLLSRPSPHCFHFVVVDFPSAHYRRFGSAHNRLSAIDFTPPFAFFARIFWV